GLACRRPGATAAEHRQPHPKDSTDRPGSGDASGLRQSRHAEVRHRVRAAAHRLVALDGEAGHQPLTPELPGLLHAVLPEWRPLSEHMVVAGQCFGQPLPFREVAPRGVAPSLIRTSRPYRWLIGQTGCCRWLIGQTGLCRGPKGSPGQNRGLAWLRVTPRAGHAGEWYRCEGRSAVAYWPPGEPAELPDIGSRLGHDRGEGSRCVTRANGSSARHTWPTTGAI